MLASIFIAAFFDTLGTVMLIPSGPILCQRAENGPIENAAKGMVAMADGNLTYPQAYTLALAEYGNPRAFESIPVGFSLSSNLLLLALQVGSAVGAVIFGRLSDLVGSKSILLVSMVGSAIGYAFVFVAGMYSNSYWLYLLAMAWSGFFSFTIPVSQAFFGKVFSPKVAEPYIGSIGAIAILGAGLGAVILAPFVTGRGDSVFYATFVGLAGSVVSIVLLMRFLDEPAHLRKMGYLRALLKLLGRGKRKSEAGEGRKGGVETANAGDAGEGTGGVEATAAKATYVRTTLLILLAGSGLDSAGDEGTRIARGTIMQALFPQTNTVTLQNWLILGTLGCVFFSILFAQVVIGPRFGFGAVCFLGALATLIGQLCFLLEFSSWGAMIAVFYACKSFGFMSNIGTSFAINTIASPETKGTWAGRNEGISKGGGALMTLVMSVVYDAFAKPPTRDVRGIRAIVICTSVSCLAVVAYAPLLCRIKPPPKPPPEPSSTPSEEASKQAADAGDEQGDTDRSQSTDAYPAVIEDEL